MLGLTEPVTALTNLILAVAAYVAGSRIFKRNRVEYQLSQALFNVMFMFLFAAAFTGFYNHGLLGPDDIKIKQILWRIVVVYTMCAFYCLFSAAATAAFSESTSRNIRWFALLFLLSCLLDWFLTSYFYAVPLFILLCGVATLLFCAKKFSGAGHISLGLCMSIGGLFLWEARVGFGPGFNHNDLYHIIQMFALFPLFRGGMQLQDRKEVVDTD